MKTDPVLTTKSEAVSNTIRKALMNEFPRLWVCVVNKGNGTRTIDVADNWGGPLQDELDKQVREFVNSLTGASPEPS